MVKLSCQGMREESLGPLVPVSKYHLENDLAFPGTKAGSERRRCLTKFQSPPKCIKPSNKLLPSTSRARLGLQFYPKTPFNQA